MARSSQCHRSYACGPGGRGNRNEGIGEEEAVVVEEEQQDPVFEFLPPGPRHNAYSFEGYRDWLGRADNLQIA